MWSTVLLMAAVGTVDPLRIGAAAFLLSRARPVRLLAVYVATGFTVNVLVGEAVLAGGRAVLGAGGTIPAPVEIAIGCILLVVGVTAWFSPQLAALVGKKVEPDPVSVPDEGLVPTVDELPALARLPRPLRAALRGEAVWVPAVLAVCMAWPGPHYLAAMAAILAADPSGPVRLAALAVFNLAEFSAALIPIASFSIAPAATRRFVDRVYGWMRVHHRLMLLLIMWTVAAIFLVMGVRHL